MVTNAEPAEVRTWLEWAGSTLLSMRLPAAAPKAYKVAWPDFPDDAKAYGYTNETLRAAAPPPDAIPIMDLVLGLPVLISDITTRRIVHSRSLVAPVSGRYLYSYKRIAVLLHLDQRAVARKFLLGVSEISIRVPASKAYTIRQFLR
jgi:hypothetical protein